MKREETTDILIEHVNNMIDDAKAYKKLIERNKKHELSGNMLFKETADLGRAMTGRAKELRSTAAQDDDFQMKPQGTSNDINYFLKDTLSKPLPNDFVVRALVKEIIANYIKRVGYKFKGRLKAKKLNAEQILVYVVTTTNKYCRDGILRAIKLQKRNPEVRRLKANHQTLKSKQLKNLTIGGFIEEVIIKRGLASIHEETAKERDSMKALLLDVVDRQDINSADIESILKFIKKSKLTDSDIRGSEIFVKKAKLAKHINKKLSKSWSFKDFNQTALACRYAMDRRTVVRVVNKCILELN